MQQAPRPHRANRKLSKHIALCAALMAFHAHAWAQGAAQPPFFFPDGDIGNEAIAAPSPTPAYPTHTPPTAAKATPTPPVLQAEHKHLAYTIPNAISAAAPPLLPSALIAKESQLLQSAFQQEVTSSPAPPPQIQALWISLANKQLEHSTYHPSKSQIIVVVDRNPKVQRLTLVVLNLNDQTWHTIGTTRISTGTKGRKDHYITPTGVFTNTADRLGYRAKGTKNEHGIMGNGTHGMRVWDFGWQQAAKGWLASREQGPIRLEMHATDPNILEKRLGHTASAGCIRIPAALNLFLDRHGLLDADYEQKSLTDKRYRALLRKDRVPSLLSGLAVVVIDSSSSIKQSPFTHVHKF